MDEADAKDSQARALRDEAMALVTHGSKELHDLAVAKFGEADKIEDEAAGLRKEGLPLMEMGERDLGKLIMHMPALTKMFRQTCLAQMCASTCQPPGCC